MYREEIEAPVRIGSEEFMRQSGDSDAKVALAAYLLVAGPLFFSDMLRADGAPVMLALGELQETGINLAVQLRWEKFHAREYGGLTVLPPLDRHIAELVTEANNTGDGKIAARAVAEGMRSEDELIRVCALASGIEFFEADSIDLPAQLAWFYGNARQALTLELLSMLLARVWGPPAAAAAGGAGGPTARRSRVTGLMAVHGTVLAFSQANRPEWSVPNQGQLYQHLSSFRPDIYGNPDYYRWEGGYTDYAREVAIQNLFDWIDRRRLSGIDVVAHSHGCNVVLGSMMKGARFGKVVLMNCPVHWAKYHMPPTGAAGTVTSVRIKFDFVLWLDRAYQRFPARAIHEHVLPFWYTGHSVCTKPSTWQRHRLDQYLV